MTGLPEKLQQIPPQVVAVADYEPLARARVVPSHWAYLNSGADDEVTLRDNCDAFARIKLRTRVLRDVSNGNTHVELFGHRFNFPFLLAPVAYQRLFHPDGEFASGVAAGALQAGMIVSTQASVRLEDMAHAKTPLWFQLYIQPDRSFTADLVRRAEEAGYKALVVTVDAPVSGLRNHERRAGFVLPDDVRAENLIGMRLPPAADTPDKSSILLGSELLQQSARWDDVAWLKSLTKLPVLLKGIMCAEDAQLALRAGADGIIVSNHGGRVLDGVPATISVLPEIVAAVEGRVPVLLDGGIRRGSDIFKALALGASAVLIGRPYVYGLAAAGAVGVAHVIQILRAELEMTMALTGCPTIDSIDQSAVYS